MLDRPATDAEKLEKLKKMYGDRNWRLDNLYYVQDETGTKVLYRRRKAQEEYSQSAWFLDLIPKARQLGMSTHIAIEITDLCVFRKNTSAGIIDYKLEDAKKKLQKIKFAYDNLPAYVRQKIYLVKDNEDELRFSNGSSVEVGTSHRGGTLQYLHVSEFGKIAAEKPEVAREIVTGAFNTVAPGQQIKVETTAHGTTGAFYDMVEKAKKVALEGRPLSNMDWKLHFYGWHLKDQYRAPINAAFITHELRAYFDELRDKHGIQLDGEQKAWYAIKQADLGEDDMRSEFPSHIDELFFNSLEGTWFKKELSLARKTGRIGQPVPFDPSRRVHTSWDKGMNEKSDRNSIWFWQTDGVRYRFIDYYENAGEGMDHYAKVLDNKRKDREFIYGTHFGPHDLKQRVWASIGGKTMQDLALEVGLKFKIVDRVDEKETAIELARRMLNLSWFDVEHTSRGVDGLDNYRKTWNKILGQWTGVPLHDWASNPADAYMTAAQGQDAEKPERTPRSDTFGKPKGSHWSQ